MFAQQLRHPNVVATLKDWRSTLNKGMLHFGRKEKLNAEFDFNTLINTFLNATPAKSGRRITLEPTLEFVGVVTSKELGHKQFRYLKNELVIVRATGRWDYAANEGPYDLHIGEEVTVRMPNTGAAARTGSQKLLKSVGKLCFSWLVLNRMTQGVGSA
jgi:hypothetical protein